MKYSIVLFLLTIGFFGCANEDESNEDIVTVEYHKDTILNIAEQILLSIQDNKTHHIREKISADSLKRLLETIEVKDSDFVNDLKKSLECAVRKNDSLESMSSRNSYYEDFDELSYRDTVIWNKKYKDTIIYNFIKKDTLVIDTVLYYDTIWSKEKRSGKFKRIN